MSGDKWLQLPDKERISYIDVQVIVRHRPVDVEDDAYVWADPTADIIREVRKALLKHRHVINVNVRITGHTEDLALDFNNLSE